VSLGFNFRMSDLCAAVLLAQLERLEEFVAWRKRAAAAYDSVVRPCPWLKPQHVPDDCEHAWWAYTVCLPAAGDGPTWQEFFDKFLELGGDWFYGAWGLTYQEPIFQDGSLGRKYEPGLCPVAESLQPRLMQFKTHYGDQPTLDRQAEALARTIRSF
jgi:perosamine synthetase